MPKRMNPMAVKANMAYDVPEAARALGVTPATIRNWIKDGLRAMTSCKPYLILGADIRDYLRQKNEAARRPLAEDELFCPACRTGRKPLKMLVTQSTISKTTDLLKGPCERCNCTATRMISARKAQAFAEIFRISKEPNS